MTGRPTPFFVVAGFLGSGKTTLLKNFLAVHAGDIWFDSVLYVGTTCGGGDLGCNDDIVPPGGTMSFLGSAVSLRALPPGRYYVTVDCFDDSAADAEYELQAYLISGAKLGLGRDRTPAPMPGVKPATIAPK